MAKPSNYNFLFQGLPAKTWDSATITYGKAPVIICRSLFADTHIPHDSIKWTSFHGRKHAFLGEEPLEYTFAGGKTLKVVDQTDEINGKVMAIAGKIKAAIRSARPSNLVLNLIRLERLEVANASLYAKGGSLAAHKDNEPAHTHDGIASISLGASATMLFEAPNSGGERPSIKAIKLHHGDLVIFDRNIRHSIVDVEGDRLNFTFRSWKKPFFKAAGFGEDHRKRRAIYNEGVGKKRTPSK